MFLRASIQGQPGLYLRLYWKVLPHSSAVTALLGTVQCMEPVRIKTC